MRVAIRRLRAILSAFALCLPSDAGRWAEQRRGTSMSRIWVIASALVLAVAMPAAAQQRSVREILERLHRLCDQDYKPACIKLGLVIGKLPPATERKLRRDHPEWWWWLRW